MADRVTCCPHCSTSFRITDAQLQTAKGAVRCGSCLQIFKALDHLMEEPSSLGEEPSSPDEEPSSPNQEPSSHTPEETGVADDDELLISDDMDRFEDTQSVTLGELSDDFMQQGSFGEHKGSLFDREIKIKENEERDNTDESWAVDLLEEIETNDDEPPASQPENTASQDNNSFSLDDLEVEVDEDEDSDETDYQYSRATTGSFAALDDDDIEEALGQSPFERTEPTFNLGADLDEDGQDTLADRDLAQLDQLEDSPTDEPTPEELLQSIAPAPVEMNWHQEANPWPRRLLWGGLSLVASMLLVIQLAWLQFDNLSRQQPYRNWYANLCPLLGCQLPPLSEPRLVKAYNLVIRSHPEVQNALVIDCILLNSAGFEQPFPDFLLTFSDIKGQHLAARRFRPNEYLGGELAGATSMPSGNPIHISLEIVDPGSEAVNYTASIPLN